MSNQQHLRGIESRNACRFTELTPTRHRIVQDVDYGTYVGIERQSALKAVERLIFPCLPAQYPANKTDLARTERNNYHKFPTGLVLYLVKAPQIGQSVKWTRGACRFYWVSQVVVLGRVEWQYDTPPATPRSSSVRAIIHTLNITVKI